MIETIFTTIIGTVVASLILKILIENPLRIGWLGLLLQRIFHKSPRVVTNVRKSKSNNFYEPHYKKSDIIRVSGIALTELINYICQIMGDNSELSNNHLMRMIKSQNKTIKILMMNPESKYISERKKTENNPLIQKTICDNIIKLMNLEKYVSISNDKKIEGKIDIRICNDKIFYTIFNSDFIDKKYGITYLGLLFPNIRGNECPLILVRDVKEQHSLYSHCFGYFESLFEKANPIFHWSNDGIYFFNNNMPSMCKNNN